MPRLPLRRRIRQIGLSGHSPEFPLTELVISCTHKYLNSMCLVFSKHPSRLNRLSPRWNLRSDLSLQSQIRQQRLHSHSLSCPSDSRHAPSARRLSPRQVLRYSPDPHSTTHRLPFVVCVNVDVNFQLVVLVPKSELPRDLAKHFTSPLLSLPAPICRFHHFGCTWSSWDSLSSVLTAALLTDFDSSLSPSSRNNACQCFSRLPALHPSPLSVRGCVERRVAR